MDSENALPAAGATGEDQQPRLALGGRRRQHADARPVGVAEIGWAILAGIERGVDGPGEKEEGEDGDQHFSERAAPGGQSEPRFPDRNMACAKAAVMRHSGTLHFLISNLSAPREGVEEWGAR